MLLVRSIVGGTRVGVVVIAVHAGREGLRLIMRLLYGLHVAWPRLGRVGRVCGTATVCLRVVWLVSVAVLHRRWTRSAHLREGIVRLRREALGVLIRIPLVLRRLVCAAAVAIGRSAGRTGWKMLIVVRLVHVLLLACVGRVVGVWSAGVGRLLL